MCTIIGKVASIDVNEPLFDCFAEASRPRFSVNSSQLILGGVRRYNKIRRSGKNIEMYLICK